MLRDGYQVGWEVVDDGTHFAALLIKLVEDCVVSISGLMVVSCDQVALLLFVEALAQQPLVQPTVLKEELQMVTNSNLLSYLSLCSKSISHDRNNHVQHVNQEDKGTENEEDHYDFLL